MSRLRIAYLSSADPHDKRSWSGIHNSVFRSLGKHCGDVEATGPWHPAFLLKAERGTAFLQRKLTRKRKDYYHTLRIAKAYGRYFTNKLKQMKADCVFAVAASSELAFLETDLPVYYMADATFANMIGYYPFYSGLSERSIREGHEVQQRALDKAAHLFLPSMWTANSAINDYGINPAKIEVVPLGANVEDEPVFSPRDIDKQVHLLFIGVEWERKGGPVALKTLEELRKRNINARLTIVGCNPPLNHPHVTIIPFLDKNDPEQRKKFNAIFSAAGFLTLPTTAECFGLVFCEASAFGVPSLATDTGGVNGAIKNGVNGILFSPTATGSDYADKIIEFTRQPDHLKALRKSSRALFEQSLNWDAWGKTVSKVLLSSHPH